MKMRYDMKLHEEKKAEQSYGSCVCKGFLMIQRRLHRYSTIFQYPITCGPLYQVPSRVFPLRPAAHLDGSVWLFQKSTSHRCSSQSAPSHSTASFEFIRRWLSVQQCPTLLHPCSPLERQLVRAQLRARLKI